MSDIQYGIDQFEENNQHISPKIGKRGIIKIVICLILLASLGLCGRMIYKMGDKSGYMRGGIEAAEAVSAECDRVANALFEQGREQGVQILIDYLKENKKLDVQTGLIYYEANKSTTTDE